jgi:hypothetical protein
VLAPFAIRSFGICDGAMLMGRRSGAVTTSGNPAGCPIVCGTLQDPPNCAARGGPEHNTIM